MRTSTWQDLDKLMREGWHLTMSPFGASMEIQDGIHMEPINVNTNAARALLRRDLAVVAEKIEGFGSHYYRYRSKYH